MKMRVLTVISSISMYEQIQLRIVKLELRFYNFLFFEICFLKCIFMWLNGRQCRGRKCGIKISIVAQISCALYFIFYTRFAKHFVEHDI